MARLQETLAKAARRPVARTKKVGGLLKKAAKMAMVTMRFVPKLADYAVVAIPVDLNAPLKVHGVPIAEWSDELRRHVGGGGGKVELACVQLAGTFVDGEKWPDKTQLYFGDWDPDEDDLPEENERATRLLQWYSEEDRTVLGNAVIVSPGRGLLIPNVVSHRTGGARVAEFLLAQDRDRQAARKAYRQAKRCLMRWKDAETQKQDWIRSATKRLHRLLPCVERTYRIRGDVGSRQLRATHALRLAAEAAGPGDRVDPFENPQDSDDNFHPWLLWRGLVVAHACQCRLPSSVCRVPECVKARSTLAANRELPIEPGPPPPGDLGGEETTAWAEAVSAAVKKLMDHNARIRDKARLVKVQQSIQLRQSKDDDRAAQVEQLRRRRNPSKNANSKRTTRRRPYEGILDFAGSLDAEFPPDGPEHSAVARCLIKSPEFGLAAAERIRNDRGTAKIVISRAHLKFFACHAKSDARGVPTGATAEEIADVAFRGNDDFFQWLLGRIKLLEPRKLSVNIGKLRFDADHGTAALKRGGLIRIAQPPPLDPLTTFDPVTFDEAMAPLAMDVPPQCDPGSDPGLAVTISSRLTLVLRMADLPCGDEFLAPDRRADLAAWLLVNADAVFRASEGILEVRRNRFANFFRRSPPSSMVPGQQRRRLITPFSLDDEGDDADLIEIAAATEEAAEDFTPSAAPTAAPGDVELVARAMEWPAMTEEDEAAERHRVLLTAPAALLDEVQRAYDTAQTDSEFFAAVLRQLMGEDADPRALREELAAISAYFRHTENVSLADLQMYWHTSRDARQRRRDRRTAATNDSSDQRRRRSEDDDDMDDDETTVTDDSASRGSTKKSRTGGLGRNPFAGFFTSTLNSTSSSSTKKKNPSKKKNT